MLEARTLLAFNLSIGTGPTTGVVFGASSSGGVYTSTANDAVLNVSDLLLALAAGDVTVATGAGGSQAGNLTLDTEFDYSSLDATPRILTLSAINNVDLRDTIKRVDTIPGSTPIVARLGLTFDSDTDNNGGGIVIIRDDILAVGAITSRDGVYVTSSGTGKVDITTGGGDLVLEGDLKIGASGGVELSSRGLFNTANTSQAGSILIRGNVESANTYAFVSTTTNFDGARRAARFDANGDGNYDDPGDRYLATVTSALENQIVAGTANYQDSFLAGSFDGSAWRWVEGPEALGDGGRGLAFWNGTNPGRRVPGAYAKFESGEPNGNGSVLQFRTPAGLFDDIPAISTRPYVVETNLPPTPLSINAGENVTLSNDVQILGDIGRTNPVGDLRITGRSISAEGANVAGTAVIAAGTNAIFGSAVTVTGRTTLFRVPTTTPTFLLTDSFNDFMGPVLFLGAEGRIQDKNDLVLASSTIGTRLTVRARGAVTQQAGSRLSGAGGLTYDGTGTMTLSGANNYTGTTVVNAGTLLVTGSTTSATSVASGGTLGGTGTIAGNVDIQAGATLAPGVSGPGILNVAGNLDLRLGSAYNVDLRGTTPGTGYDQVRVSGGVATFGGGRLNVAASSPLAPADGQLFSIIAGGVRDTATGGQTAQGGVVTSTGLPRTYQILHNAPPAGVAGDLVLRDQTSPADLVSVVPSPATITAATVGNGTFALTVTFNKDMDPSVSPTLTFPTPGEDPLPVVRFASGAWTGPRTYRATYNVASLSTSILAIDVRVSGAIDDVGRPAAAATVPDVFTVAGPPPAVRLAVSPIFFREIAAPQGSPFSGPSQATVTATLDRPSATPTTVALTFGGTATRGTDYTVSATSITIPAGMTSGTVTLTAIQDALLEGRETIVVGLGTITNGTAGTPSSVTANLDDATVDVSIAQDDGLATVAPGQAITYTIVVSNPASGGYAQARVVDSFPSQLTNISWVATGSGSSSGTSSGTGNIDEVVNLPPGTTFTYRVTATVAPGATGTLANTATVSTAPLFVEAAPANNTATDTDTITPTADLSVSNTDNKTTAIPGTLDFYTITVANAGPSGVTGAGVSDIPPPALANVSWTAVVLGGATVPALSGTGPINQIVDLPAGSSILYTIAGLIAPSAMGNLTNSVTVTPPMGAIDPDTTNNSVTDTDTLTPIADLRIVANPQPVPVTPGDPVMYTLTVDTAGPSDTNAFVAHMIPADFTNASWTAVFNGGATGTAAGTGDITAEAVFLPVGGSIVYTIMATASPSASSPITLGATVLPSVTTDPDLANNSVQDSTVFQPKADLSVVSSPTVPTAIPGATYGYTAVFHNAGPSDVTDALASFTLPAALSGATWSATFTGGANGSASGSGDISELVTIPAGGTVRYQVTGLLDATATGSLLSIASLSTPGGVLELDPSNNQSGLNIALVPTADLDVIQANGVSSAVPGTTVTYTIVVTNSGPSFVTGASFVDDFSSTLGNLELTAISTLGGVVSTLSPGPLGGQTLLDTLTLPPNGQVSYTVTGVVLPSATGAIAARATVTPPGMVIESDPSNNTSPDIDPLNPTADLVATLTDGQTTAVPGASVTYTVVVTNAGPSDAPGSYVLDPLSAILVGATWTAAFAGGATGNASGVGDISEFVDLPAGSSVTYTIAGVIPSSAVGMVENAVLVLEPSTVTDPLLDNNIANDINTLAPTVDLGITKTEGLSAAIPGSPVTYIITVTNAGPSDAAGARVIDILPADLTGVTWTATLGGGATGATSGSGDIDQLVNIPAGGSISYLVRGMIPAAATGTLTNTASVAVAAGTIDANASNDAATDTATLTPVAGLAVTLTDSRTTAVPGTATTYTLVVTNAGPSDAVGSRVLDQLPSQLAGATWTAAFSGGATGSASGSGDINELVNVPVGGMIVYTINATVRPDARGALANTSTVMPATTEPDGDTSDNVATDMTALTPRTDLAVTKVTSSPPVRVGSPLTYTIGVTNTGPSDATSVTITDALPAGMTFVSGTSNRGVVRFSNGTVTVDLGTLVSGASATVTIVVEPTSTAAGLATNIATASATEVDTNPTDNTASVDVTVLCMEVGADYDGDGAVDLALFSYDASGAGHFDILLSSGGMRTVALGMTGDIPVVGDFDGDGLADPAVFRPNFDIDGDGIPDAAAWIILQSSDGQTRQVLFGAPGGIDLPAPADYDGDGITDIATFRPTATAFDLANYDPEGDGIGGSQWFLLRSSDGATRLEFGAPDGADLPVPADYDGDGKADIATFRSDSDLTPGVAEWFIRPSSGASGYRVAFGAPAGADLPVPLDYDGDCLVDIATYRPASDLTPGAAEWFIRRPPQAIVHGNAGELAAPGDYDADGRADLAVFDRSASRWSVRSVLGGSLREETFGPSSMTVVASSVVPVLAPLTSRLAASEMRAGTFGTAAHRSIHVELLDLVLDEFDEVRHGDG